LSWPFAYPLPLPGEDSVGGATEGSGAEAEAVEASIPRSLACSAAAAEEEFPGATGCGGVGEEVVAFGGVGTGWLGGGEVGLVLPSAAEEVGGGALSGLEAGDGFGAGWLGVPREPLP
jgi:hypothetical protein